MSDRKSRWIAGYKRTRATLSLASNRAGRQNSAGGQAGSQAFEPDHSRRNTLSTLSVSQVNSKWLVGRRRLRLATLFRKSSSGNTQKSVTDTTQEYREGIRLLRGTKDVEPDYAQAVEHLETAAKGGDEHAMFELGMCFRKGLGVDACAEKAAVLFKRAFEKGHPSASFNYGVCLQTGQGVPKDALQAFKVYQKAAERGSAEAEYNVAVMYETGSEACVQQNSAEAFKMFQLSAEKGFPKAQYRMACLYELGHQRPDWARSPESAMQMYTRAASQGHDKANHRLGKCYEHGQLGVPVDMEKAFHHYSVAWKCGNKAATRRLQKLCVKTYCAADQSVVGAFTCKQPTAGGKGHPKVQDAKAVPQPTRLNYMKDPVSWKFVDGHVQTEDVLRQYEEIQEIVAIPELKDVDESMIQKDGGRSSNDVDLETMFKKAYSMVFESDAVKQMEKVAAEEKSRAEAQEAAQAQDDDEDDDDDEEEDEAAKESKEKALASIARVMEPRSTRFEGLAGKEDGIMHGMDMLEEAANLGHVRAAFYLGVALDKGYGGRKSRAGAVKWFMLGAKHRHPESAYNLGLCYEEGGAGVKANMDRAKEWFVKAATMGNAMAQFRLGLLLLEGQKAPRNLFEANNWLHKAAEQGISHAQFMKGRCLEYGLGIKVSHEDAVAQYQLAAAKGHIPAMLSLAQILTLGVKAPKNYQAAASLLQEAMRAGSTRAKFKLHFLYETGKGVAKNPALAMRMLNECVKEGDPEAIGHLAIKKSTGDGMRQELAEARALFKKAASKAGIIAKMHMAGELKMKYSAVDLRRPSPEPGQADVLKTQAEEKAKKIKVYRMFRHAAEQGVTVAAFSLAVCYHKGEGTSKDDDDARKWFQVAAEQGHGQSAFNLGVLLEKEAAESDDKYHTAEKLKEATYWFKEAAKTGHPKARFNTGEWAGSLPLIKQAKRKGIAYRLVDANWRILEPDEDLFTKVLSPMEQLLKSQRGREASTYSLGDTVSPCPEEVLNATRHGAPEYVYARDCCGQAESSKSPLIFA
ncbi:hypothetical protein CYMTET_48710 [Cymbomonas tetramitiformis]|uniref:Secretory immunoglobulin A-binding protein EsiB n=1 Tax=Cymbomonas tetramitiformis TaxID=36881 RepID=A0AAE0BRT6_9CHLO|nr:hypothetical protein CYMTET_48710 [Cymbomonas tetramitiformis]